MAQEEHSKRCSNSSTGGGGGGGDGNGNGSCTRSFRRLKQTKVPQRGLGVAQLEKIRLEEQRKKDAALQAASILPPNPIISPGNSSSCLAIQGGLVSNFGRGQGNLPRLPNGEYNREEENVKLEHHGFKLPSNMHLPYESNTRLWPLPSVMQGSQLFQSASSVVNVLPGTSSSSTSSMINFQIEPPSNQSYCDKYTPLWLEREEKMVGMKRPYPFSLDNPPGPSFCSKVSSSFVAPVSRPTESASCNNAGTDNIETSNPREDPSSSSGISELNPEKVMKQNGGLDGDFLTLAPPATSFYHLNCKQKLSSSNVWVTDEELSQLESLPHQGSIIKGAIHQPGPDGSTLQPIFSFLPLVEAQTDEAATMIRNGNGEVGESVDLNLKL